VKIFGIDFTSAPAPRKPITCVYAELSGDDLHVRRVDRWTSFASFEAALAQSGPWIAGIDFPFGQSSKFIENIGWPSDWPGYVRHVSRMSRSEFREQLDAYRKHRAPGDKEHRRSTDVAAGSISPQKLFGVPVGLMFFEGAPRLLESAVTVPGVLKGDSERIVVEAYPGILARHLIGRQSYKNDNRKKQTDEQKDARNTIVHRLQVGNLLVSHGVRVHVNDDIADDPGADDLDALLCAVQAAWAWHKREERFGAPLALDPNEGWIADPMVVY